MKSKNVIRKIIMYAILAISFVLTSKQGALAAEVVPVITDEGTSVSALPNHNVKVPVTGRSVLPIQIKEPGQLNVRVNGAQTSDTAKISLFADEACSNPASSVSYFYLSQNETKLGEIQIAKAGVYYLEVKYNQTGRTEGMINITPYLYSRADRKLAEGAWSTLIAPSYSGSNPVHCQITVPSNGYIGIEAATQASWGVYVALCNADKSEIVKKSFKSGETRYYPVKKGTYYISTEGLSGEWCKIRYNIHAGDITLKQKTTFVYYLMGKTNMDFKFKAEKTGIVTFGNGGDYAVGGTLLNSKKKELSNAAYGKAFSYAVKKGVTYYFRVEDYNDMNAIVYNISGAKESKNATKKKAVLLEKKKKQTCLIVAGRAKKKYWYRFDVKKASKLTINIPSMGSGKTVYYVYNNRGEGVKCSLIKNKLKSYYKLAKGTYYLAIEPKDKTSGKIDLTLK